MRAIFTVYKRELAIYFRSPIAYAIAFALMLFMGLQFSYALIFATQANIQAQQFGGGQQYTLMTILGSVQLLTFLMFLVGPLLTMRLIAEENREGTLEVLMTLPMNEYEFIVGKFLASWTYYTFILVLTLVHAWLGSAVGNLDYGLLIGQYVGAWLYGAAVLAICLIWSAVTEDQLVAAFLGALSVLILYVSNWAYEYVINLSIFINSQIPGAELQNEFEHQLGEFVRQLGEFVRQLGVEVHYTETMSRGIIRLEDIAYFVFMTIAALFITTRIVETRRWRS